MWITDVIKGLETNRASRYEVSHVSVSFKFRLLWNPQRKQNSSLILQRTRISNVATHAHSQAFPIGQSAAVRPGTAAAATAAARSGAPPNYLSLATSNFYKTERDWSVSVSIQTMQWLHTVTFWGSRSRVTDDSSLLRCYALSSDTVTVPATSGQTASFMHVRPWRWRHRCNVFQHVVCYNTGGLHTNVTFRRVHVNTVGVKKQQNRKEQTV